MNPDDPIDDRYREKMNVLAKMLDEAFNENPKLKAVGYTLLVYDFVGPRRNRMNYISNSDRADVVRALREMADRLEGKPDEKGSQG